MYDPAEVSKDIISVYIGWVIFSLVFSPSNLIREAVKNVLAEFVR